jgi:uncharacterized protein (TIGR03435 family)
MKPWRICTVFLPACLAFAQQPAGKLEFEVASIKPSPADQVSSRMSTDAGMLRYGNVSLKDCIRAAYGVSEFQIQGPDWLGRARFDITAKLPAGASRRQVPAMMQCLLEDRFKLKIHREHKDAAVYGLVASKRGAKVKPLDPDTDGTYRGQMLADGVHLDVTGPAVSLAERLSQFTDRPVVDMTGLQGKYNFTLVFTGRMDSAMPSMRDALDTYGLSLEPRKAPVELLVVDAAERVPSEN